MDGGYNDINGVNYTVSIFIQLKTSVLIMFLLVKNNNLIRIIYYSSNKDVDTMREHLVDIFDLQLSKFESNLLPHQEFSATLNHSETQLELHVT